ncbi:Glycosyltransferase family 10 (fucosyltransferase) [Stieleria maiorica]|uniref:Glycosyltransferase family 10 (Fucosyltransferase) n=1 Tax=Stieleria maiorica TaxID=2795974 RepID=A0A5B9MG49_9BACT|nr:glycosyltransferase family 10 [Stieleria maiorica]QEF99479.1 Glycosyltransferase family 10 (fucosyltransferase) [Stieleria maiorica]
MMRKLQNLASRITRTPHFEVGSEHLIDCDLEASAPVVHVDCYGRSFYRRVEVAYGGARWKFHYDPRQRLNVPFVAGVFFDRSAIPGSHLLRVPKQRRAAVLVETPNENFFGHFPDLGNEFGCVMTHRTDLLDLGQPFVELAYGTNWVPVGDPAKVAEGHGKTKDLSFLGSIQHDDVHGYMLRRQVAEWLGGEGVECFGHGLKSLSSKTDGLVPYRFSIAMENIRSPGYFTEKLIDCFHCGTVPVYWGDPSITSVFDLRGMVIFENLSDLKRVLPTLNADRYQMMLPFVVDNLKKAIALDVADTAGMYRRIAATLSSVMPAGDSRSHGQLGRVARHARQLLGNGR